MVPTCSNLCIVAALQANSSCMGTWLHPWVRSRLLSPVSVKLCSNEQTHLQQILAWKMYQHVWSNWIVIQLNLISCIKPLKSGTSPQPKAINKGTTIATAMEVSHSQQLNITPLMILMPPPLSPTLLEAQWMLNVHSKVTSRDSESQRMQESLTWVKETKSVKNIWCPSFSPPYLQLPVNSCSSKTNWEQLKTNATPMSWHSIRALKVLLMISV